MRCMKFVRCKTLQCKQLAENKMVFDWVAAAWATESFWKIMTNITLSTSQVEPRPLFDLCLSLTLISFLTTPGLTSLQYCLRGKDQSKEKNTCSENNMHNIEETNRFRDSV